MICDKTRMPWFFFYFLSATRLLLVLYNEKLAVYYTPSSGPGKQQLRSI